MIGRIVKTRRIAHLLHPHPGVAGPNLWARWATQLLHLFSPEPFLSSPDAFLLIFDWTMALNELNDPFLLTI